MATAAPVTINDRSIAIQKTVLPINPATGLPNATVRVGPGTVLQYTVNYEVSDFFAFNNFSLTDVIGDGQDFVDLTKGQIRFYRLRRRESGQQMLIKSIPYEVPKRLSKSDYL